MRVRRVLPDIESWPLNGRILRSSSGCCAAGLLAKTAILISGARPRKNETCVSTPSWRSAVMSGWERAPTNFFVCVGWVSDFLHVELYFSTITHVNARKQKTHTTVSIVARLAR